MKAHEQTLELRFNGGNTCFTAESGEIVAYVRKPEWQSLLGAAPDMARALLEARYWMEETGWSSRDEWVSITAALKKAGVL